LETGLVELLPAAVRWWRKLGEHADIELVMLAGLLSPLAPQTAIDVAERRLRLPAAESAILKRCLHAVEELPKLLGEGADSALYQRLHALPGEAICLLRARTLQQGDAASPQRERLERYATTLRPVHLSIGGADLKAAGVAPGPAMGKALQATLDARLDGLIKGAGEELKYALEWLSSHGRQ
jgi:hypothetical protein